MKVLVVGSGAREHAIVWALFSSSSVDTIYCAPGNGGTSLLAQNLNMSIDTESACDQLAGWAFSNSIDLAIIGPEVPLHHGMADTLQMLGVPVLGPTQAAARIEWSKAWARDFMRRHDIPSPDYKVLRGMEAVLSVLHSEETTYPLVLKADGLAAGKGAAVVEDAFEGELAITQMQASGALPADLAGMTVVIEEFLTGMEVSAMAFTDGSALSMMPPVCDYKRLLDGEKGPLTGGMGAYTPPETVTPELWSMVEADILRKAVTGLASEGTPFKGVLYAGLMLTEDGPKVLEFNCRLGDPETQVLLPRLKTSFADIALAIAAGDLSQVGPIEWNGEAAVGVVLASEDYPVSRAASRPVVGLSDATEGALVFHAGTEARGSVSIQPNAPLRKNSIISALFSQPSSELAGLTEPEVLASGGRVLTVVGRGADIEEARQRAYQSIGRIKLDGGQYRTDIGLREVNDPTAPIVRGKGTAPLG